MDAVFANEPEEILSAISSLIRIRSRLQTVSLDEAKAEKQRLALQAYDQALRKTVAYMEDLKSGRKTFDQAEEFELSQRWSAASIAISDFDPQLANRCFIKGQGWLDPKVWEDPRYKKLHIGIDDMREALMEFNEKRYQQTREDVPDWFSKAGVGFAIATFLSLFYLLVGPDLTTGKRVIFDAWMAFCVAASAAFLGGTAVSNGTLKIPFMKDTPVQFSAYGGIAIFIVLLLILLAANH